MKQMNLFKMLLAGALVLALASCEDMNSVEIQNPVEQGGKGSRTETIGLQLEPATKVILSNDATPAFAWEFGDKISVWAGISATDDDGKFQEGEVKNVSGDKKLSVTIPDGQNRFHYAIYPSSVSPAYDVTTGDLTITLPSSYTLNELSGTKTPVPMIALNTEGNDLVFYNVGGALRLTVRNIPVGATGLKIQFPGKKVHGSFTVANPGSIPSDTEPGPTISTTATSVSGADIITVNFPSATTAVTEETLNIPLPTGTYEYVYITPVGSETKVAAIRNINSISATTVPYSATRAHGKKLTTAMVSFSVSDTKKVFFSPGNLVKTDASYEVGSGNESYAFEAKPFNTNGGSLGYGGDAPTLTSARGYFTWNEIATADESPRVFTVNNVSGWSAMTYDEWEYLIYSEDFDKGRTMNQGVRRKYNVDLETTGEKIGLLIPPDQATSDDVSALNEDGTITREVDIDTFISKGFIFLPDVGWYTPNWMGWTTGTGSTGVTGYYWCTTEEDDDWAYYFQFHTASGYGDDYDEKGYYCSVRLVHE